MRKLKTPATVGSFRSSPAKRGVPEESTSNRYRLSGITRSFAAAFAVAEFAAPMSAPTLPVWATAMFDNSPTTSGTSELRTKFFIGHSVEGEEPFRGGLRLWADQSRRTARGRAAQCGAIQ